MAEKELLLHAEQIDKAFGPTHAVDHVSLDFYKGEVHCLIGENGSGKSTFTNMLTGILPIGSGTFTLEGQEVAPTNQVDANHHGIAIIVQEQGTLDGLTVAENMFLGDEGQFMHNGIKNTGAMVKKAQELLDDYGFNYIKAADPIENYTFEERKLVEIVKATWFNPKVLVVDETTTALSQDGRYELFKVINRVRDHGDCVIMIDHDMDIVMSMADRISVLRDGEYIATVNKADVDADKLKTLMVGREMNGKYYRTDWGESLASDVAMKVDHVSVPGELEDISLELHNGEILGIGGLSECGMHELGKAMFGASYERTGSVTLADGTEIDDINTAIDHGVAYTSKDRDKESLLINDTIADNITLPSLRDYGKILTGKKIRTEADTYAKEMSTKMVSVNQFVSALSGGNKQKVVIARWLAKHSDILLLDSPTRGIDIKVKADIYNLLDDMRQQGKAVLIISEEIAELMGMCDRILIMKDHKIEKELVRDKSLTDTEIIKYMI